MNALFSRLPAGVRLGLRDLGHNKRGAVGLVVFLALAIGVAMPLILMGKDNVVADRVNQYNPSYDSAFNWDPPSSANELASQHTSEEILQAQASATQDLKDPQEAFGKFGLTPVTLSSSYIEWANCDYQDESADQSFCDDSGRVVWANWEDSKVAAGQVQLMEGRLPSAVAEIAIYKDDNSPSGIRDLEIGDVVEGLIGSQTYHYKVVGIAGNESTYPAHAAYAAKTIQDAAHTVLHVGVGPRLSDADAYALGLELNSKSMTQEEFFDWDSLSDTRWYSWRLRAFQENQELLVRAAKDYPVVGEDGSPISSPDDSTSELAFIGVLLGITLLSVPLYWQNNKRRATTRQQLVNSGAPRHQLALMSVTPAVVVGVSAAVLGLLGSYIAMSLIERSDFENLLWSLRVSTSLGYIIVTSLSAGILPALIASLLPELMSSFSKTAQERFTDKPLRFEKTWSVAWPILFVVIGLTVLLLQGASTMWIKSSTAALILIVCAVLIIVGVYWLYGWAFTRLGRLASDTPAGFRIAAKELQTSGGSAINICIPITLLAAGAAFATVSGQQHDTTYREFRDSEYLEAFLPFSFLIAGMILLLTYLVVSQTSTEVHAHRAALNNVGMSHRDIKNIDGYRALFVAALGCVTGYLLGTVIGVAAMLDWSRTNSSSFKVSSLIPDLGILVAIGIPLALSFFVGRLAGASLLRRTTSATPLPSL